jgi:adenine/guanine phosphoribosyltransferase-like PRPP-binding protein
MVYPEDNIVGRVKIDREVLESEIWKRAKEKADFIAAKEIVDRYWNDKKIEQLKKIVDPKRTIAITQPSTSGYNVLPIALAMKIKKETGVPYLIGDEYFESLHTQQAKHMTRTGRIFNRRVYEVIDRYSLLKAIKKTNVIVIEDLLTSGGSAASFCRALKVNKCNVKSVVALMGDRRLNIDLKTTQKLQQVFDEKRLPYSASDLSQILTRTETGYLIMMAKNVRTDNGKEKIAGKIQRLYDQGFVENLGRNQKSRGHECAKRNDIGDAGIAERISPWDVSGHRRERDLTAIKKGLGRSY